MADTEGVNIVISGDSSQAVKAVKDAQGAIDKLKGQSLDVDVSPKFDNLGRLHKANGQFMTMGEKLAANFSSSFMKGFAEISVKLDDFGKKVEGTFDGIFKIITKAASSVAGTISTVAKSALSIGGGFEAQITNVKVISGATEEELDMLIKKAREMGATLPITAKDAATAMQMLAQRGTQAKDILSTVSEVANLTISQGVDMGTAADLLGSTMTNFGIAVQDANQITNMFNNACNQSALSMTKLVEGMKYVGPAAGAVNLGLSEALAAMEAIANAGLTGEMTGTGLAMVLSKLAAVTDICGVKTKNLDGSLRPIADIFSELSAKGFSLVDAISVFGQRGSKAALALARNSESLKQNEERLKTWGSTQHAVDEKAKTFTNTMAALRSAIEEFHIEVFEQIKNQSKEAVAGITELVRAFSQWVGESKIAEKTLNAFLDGLGFKIPSGDDFKRLLDNLDLQAFVNRVISFGQTIKGIAESIAGFFSTIKTPLTFLIEHLETFAIISFWGWILGKGLQVPAAILGIVIAFEKLHTVLKGLTAINFASLAGFLASPLGLVGAGVVASVGGAIYAASKMSSANEQLRNALDEEKRYLAEQAQADLALPLDIQLNIKTGFEKLPASWAKASDKLRAEADITVKTLQEQFRGKVAQAVEFVTDKFPELSEAFKGTADDINRSVLSKISAALHGSEADFEALPEIWKKVAERINAVDTGLDKFGLDLYGISEKYRQFRQEVQQPIQKDEISLFSEDIYAGIRSITEELPAEIERAQKFLNGSDGQLAVKVSISQAQSKIDQLAKSISEKFNLPKDIVDASILDYLKKLATAGNEAAQSLANGLGSANDALDTFLANAQEAITYLGASPDKFMPALNSMMQGIQRIDPITGKLTEKFKKAYDALKKWENITFDQLTGRIKRLRSAVEGGFIDQSALEAEFRSVLPQLKLQVVNELKPQKEQYHSEREYQAVVASELIGRISDLFGEVGVNLARDTFANQDGQTMGRLIVQEVENSLLNNSATFTLNGIDQIKQGLQDLPQNIAGAVNPLVSSLEQSANQQTNSGSEMSTLVPEFQKLTAALENNTSALGKAGEAVISFVNSAGTLRNEQGYMPSVAAWDYSSVIASIVNEIKASSQDNVQAVNSVKSAVNSVENAVISVDTSLKSLNSGNNFNIEINQQGFVIEKKSDADVLASSTATALRTGLSNGGI